MSRDLNRLNVDKALHLGTAEILTPPERCLMAGLLAHLDISRTAGDATSVWPSSERLCRLLNIAPSSLRRLKSSLEEKGFILRRYDHRNRPLREGALDLRPFLLLVPQLLQDIGDEEASFRAERDNLHAERHDHCSALSTQAPKTEPPIRNPQPEISDAAKDDQDDECWALAGKLSAPLRQSGPISDPLRSAQDLAQQLFGPDQGNRLLHWAQRRHGSEALLALAIAAEDPALRDREAWFAWYATSAETVDLKRIAKKLLSGRKAPLELPTSADPLTAAFVKAFAQAAGEEACASYLSDASVEAVADRLTVRVRGRLARERLRDRFAGELGQVAEKLGVQTVTIAEVTSRAAGP